MYRLAAALLLALAGPALSAPASYVLEPTASSVGFETDFGPDRITGRMPVTRADLTIDFDQVSNSTVAVTIDVQNAEASFPFAAQAMKGPKVLDAKTWPEITFASTSVRPAGDGATVDGNVTIRPQHPAKRAPADKNGVYAFAERAKNGPRADFRLRHEGRRKDRIDGEDVQP